MTPNELLNWIAKVAQSSAASDLLNGFAELNSVICTEPSLAAALSKAKNPNPEFSPEEEVQLNHLCTRLCNIYLQAEGAYKNDHLDEENFAMAKSDIGAHLRMYPGNNQFFESILTHYPGVSDREVIQGIRNELGAQSPDTRPA